MPVDKSIDDEDFSEDEKDDGAAAGGARRRFREFECPECAAHNPADDGFGNGDDIICNYCGTEYRVIVSDEGKLKLKST